MSNTPSIIRYPLDASGVSPTNAIIDELHDLSARPTRAIAPYHGPFYSDSVRIFDAYDDRELDPTNEYEVIEYYEYPSRLFGKEICAVILITQPNKSTKVRIEYQCVGGPFSYSNDAIVRMIDTLNVDDRPVHWPNVIGKPDVFEPAPHMHDIGDTYGWEYIVQALESIRQAVLMGDSASHDEILQLLDDRVDDLMRLIQQLDDRLTAHLNDESNPHKVTKAQVGLGLVENWRPATQVEAEAGASPNTYMTPLRTKQAIDALIRPDLNRHLDDKTNPHDVTKSQVGLGLVENWRPATKNEAEGGTTNNVYMTPLRVKEAIDSQIRPTVVSHIANRSNPHGVTKSQVGLSNIPNSTTDSRSLNSNSSLLTAKGMYDHVRSGDHDNRYALSSHFRISGAAAQAFVNGSWRQIWPPQWQ